MAKNESKKIADQPSQSAIPKRKKTFAEEPGLPANQQAKELAQAASRKKKQREKYPFFYTRKGVKVLKMVMKRGKTLSIYLGNLKNKKHKVFLDPAIVKWKKDGLWIEEHAAKAKAQEVQRGFDGRDQAAVDAEAEDALLPRPKLADLIEQQEAELEEKNEE